MFFWTDERIAFMRDAERETEYYRVVAEKIRRLLPASARLCDAGCGLGFLSFALSAHFPQITAVDRDEKAVAFVRQELSARALSGVRPVCADVLQLPCEPLFDAMIFCYFGRMEQILLAGARLCRGRLIVIKKNYARHRFTSQPAPLEDETADGAQLYLRRRAIAFSREDFSVEFGQPFRSEEDALRFFACYDANRPDPAALRQLLQKRLIRRQDAAFPFYLPQEKKVSLFVIDAEEARK